MTLPSWFPRRPEFKLAGRTIARTPLLTATAVLSLAIGISLAASAYGVVGGMLFAKLDVPEGERIVQLRDVDVERGYDYPLEYNRYLARLGSVTSLAPFAVFHTAPALIERTAGTGRVVTATTLSPNGFDVLRVRAAAGRAFTAADPEAETMNTLVLGHSIAVEHFNVAQAAVGQSLIVDGVRRTIIGVMAEGFRFPHTSDAWVPASRATVSNDAPFMAYGRLAPGATMASAATEYGVVAARDRATGSQDATRMVYRVLPFARPAPSAAVNAALWLSVAGLVVLLLVSAANVANLLLARTAARGFEFAVRSALGASRARLVSQIAIEAIAMAALAAALGGFATSRALEWFRTTIPDVPYWLDFSMRWDLIAFVAGIAGIAALVVSLLPARRVATLGLAQALRDHSSGFRFGRTSSVLIALELAIAVGMLGAIGSAGRGLLTFGFGEASLPSEQIVVAQLYFGDAPALSRPDAPTERRARRAVHETYARQVWADANTLVERLRVQPGISAVGLGSHFPGNEMMHRVFEIEGVDGARRTTVIEAGTGYFESAGARILRGRAFNERELNGQGAAVVVNARFAERYGLGNAVGRRIRFLDEGIERSQAPWLEIVGVAPDMALNPGNAAAADGIYRPMRPTTVVRVAMLASGAPQMLGATLHAQALTLSTKPQVQWSKTLSAQMNEPVMLLRSLGAALIVLGVIALLLSGAGIYALLSLRVTRQRRDIAVRMALGAPSSSIARSVLGRTMVGLGIGTAAGLGIAVALSRAIAAIPYEVGTSDGRGLAMTAVVLGVIAAGGCAVPLARALRVRPMALLRE